MSACLPDRNLCTPDQAFVAQSGAGYHFVLPANVEWGASIPNPAERPVMLTNDKGIVCWDLKRELRKAAAGCQATVDLPALDF